MSQVKHKLLLMYSTHNPSPGHIMALEKRLGKGAVRVADSEDDAKDKASDVEIIFGHRYLRQVLPYTKQLRWVQSTAGGVDRLPLNVLIEKNICLTRNTIDSSMVARHAYTLAWSLIRALPQNILNLKKHLLDKALPILSTPKSVMILGTGSIGQEIARLFNQDGIKVLGFNRSGSVQNNFHAVFTKQNWQSILPEIDVLLMALPNDSEIYNLVDKTIFDLLPVHAIVINVGRGETLNLADLCKALREKIIAGAGLDVCYPPPAKNDPLWDIPNLILTSHIGSVDPDRPSRIERFCELQLDHYLKGENLESIVRLDF